MMLGIVLVIALIGIVYLFGKYTNTNEKAERNIEFINNESRGIINVVVSLVVSVVIVVAFIVLFEILGAQQEQMGIFLATVIVFTMLFCTYSIIDEIRKFRDIK